MSDRMTCGACMGSVKAGKGRIAHHGYKRPGHGWQTTSCMGARMLPWEVSPEGGEALKNAILHQLPQAEEELANLQAPRESLTMTYKDFRGQTVTNTWVKGGGYVDGERFEQKMSTLVYNAQNKVTWMKQDLKEVTARLATWKPAEKKEAA